jgi:heterodisulfide reductase subunit C
MYLFQNGGLVTDKPTMASMCVQCEQCLEKCPQHLPITDLLIDVKEDMEGFMTKPLIWLGRRVMKVRKRKKQPMAVSTNSMDSESKKQIKSEN